jgi:hypothetical protein
MGRVLQHLHSEGVGVEELRRRVVAIPLAPGMGALLLHVAQHRELYDAVVVSDSNSHFIRWILEHRGLGQAFSQASSAAGRRAGRRPQAPAAGGRPLDCAQQAGELALQRRRAPDHAPRARAGRPPPQVFTNPASITPEGGLAVAHHHGHGCSSCPANMCKQEVVRQHMQRAETAGGGGGGGGYSRVVYVGDGGPPALAGLFPRLVPLRDPPLA